MLSCDNIESAKFIVASKASILYDEVVDLLPIFEYKCSSW